MKISTPLEMMGAPGSPYTRKMRSLLRYRRIPYQLVSPSGRELSGRPRARVPLMPTFYLENERGEIEAVTDSTPLIRRFEAAFEGREVVPPDPVVAFVDELLEDFADEWLTKAMFHYRWAYRADVEKAARVLPLWGGGDAPVQASEQRSKMIAERQIGRLPVVGSSDVTAPVIEGSFLRIVRALDAHLARHTFLMGERPGASDFAFFGQLTCLALFDPTPAAIVLRESPRIVAWVEWVEDLSGRDARAEDWITRDAIPETLRALIEEAGRSYTPFMVANAAAIASGAERVQTEIGGAMYVQKPFPYQAKCLRWLQESHERLSADDRAAVDALLAGSGCEALFA